MSGQAIVLYLSRANQQYGPYSIEQVRGWLRTGQVSPMDYVCYQGSSSWIQLYSLPELAGQLPPMRPPVYVAQQQGSGWGLMIPGMIMAFFGMLLSVTIIGALLGVPMTIGGFIMIVLGRIQYGKRVMADLQNSIRAGIVQGMQPTVVQGMQPTEPPRALPPST